MQKRFDQEVENMLLGEFKEQTEQEREIEDELQKTIDAKNLEITEEPEEMDFEAIEVELITDPTEEQKQNIKQQLQEQIEAGAKKQEPTIFLPGRDENWEQEFREKYTKALENPSVPKEQETRNVQQPLEYNPEVGILNAKQIKEPVQAQRVIQSVERKSEIQANPNLDQMQKLKAKKPTTYNLRQIEKFNQLIEQMREFSKTPERPKPDDIKTLRSQINIILERFKQEGIEYEQIGPIGFAQATRAFNYQMRLIWSYAISRENM